MHVAEHAATRPDKVAYRMGRSGEAVTYGQLDERSSRLAHLFHDRGLRPGDVVAVLMENNARYLEVTWAAQRSGLYYTCVNPRLTPPEVLYIVDDCGARALVTSAALGPVAAEVVAATPRVETRLVVGGELDGHEPYEDAVRRYPPRPPATETEGSEMLYSSGTTGRPKGVRRPTGQSANATVAVLCQMLYGVTDASVYLCTAPLYHAAPLYFTMAVTRLGATAVIMERYDPLEFLRLIERHRVTHAQVVPTMFVRLLKLAPEERARFDLSTLQVCIHAAAPCPVPVKEQMIEWWGPILHEYYAGTEGNGFCVINSDEWLAHKGSVGKNLLGPVHIVDDDGKELPPYAIGTVYFGGQADFEYHNDPEKTGAARHKQGWTTLGDIGHLDDEGYLYLTDRRADMIVRGGVNVYPQEAENVLATHPKVLDVAVFGVPDEDLGEEVKAVVQPVDGADAGPGLEQELIAFCRQHLASYKCPRSVDFEAELPRAPTGKLYKRLLKDRYWAGHATRIL
jgi:long-chain acyl-CoA synthetase